MKTKTLLFIIIINSWVLSACRPVKITPAVTVTQVPPTDTLTPTNTPKPTSTPIPPTPTVDPDFIPQFVDTDFVDLSNIQQISLFRSSVGHDYSDNFEKCRSMKHYYRPYENIDWSTIKIFAPADGVVTIFQEEWAGFQIHIQSTQYPNYRIIIFHVNPNPEMDVGYHLTSGMEIGTHIGNMTHLDIAVASSNVGIHKYVSYFDVMTDNLFQKYQIRGIENRSDLIISQEQRDAEPLTCGGETFTSQGNLPNWFTLK